ncbi:MAG: transglycosylase SLT domain-containing protein [Candidatus Dormibacteraceae bacterium]
MAALVAELGSSTTTLDEEAAAAARLEAQTPADAFAAAQLAMQSGAAEERFRNTVRHEQQAVYQLAGNPTLAAQVETGLGARAPAGLPSVLSALQALWVLTGATDPAPLFARPFDAALPVATLQGYYEGAAARQGLDWRYLAAINYIESDFDRDTDVSSAGAEGPLQFLPSTWAIYGDGGDIDDPQDAIEAAARYLRAMGAPGDYSLAILRYNDDSNYVAAVTDLASAIGAQGLWLDRLYYWSTYG